MKIIENGIEFIVLSVTPNLHPLFEIPLGEFEWIIVAQLTHGSAFWASSGEAVDLASPLIIMDMESSPTLDGVEITPGVGALSQSEAARLVSAYHNHYSLCEFWSKGSSKEPPWEIGRTVLLKGVQLADLDELSSPTNTILSGELGTRFCFRRFELGDPVEKNYLVSAEEALWNSIGARFFYDRRCALHNVDLSWIPYCFMGSGGFLVERKSNRVIRLDSGFGDIVVYVWAYYKGLLGKQESEGCVDLRVEAIGDREKARKLIESFSTPRIAREALNSFAAGSCCLPAVTLGFCWRELREAEEEGWFRFKAV